MATQTLVAGAIPLTNSGVIRHFALVIGQFFTMSPAPHENRTDLQLVAALNQGDAAAFDVLYFRHRDWVMHWPRGENGCGR